MYLNVVEKKQKKYVYAINWNSFFFYFCCSKENKKYLYISAVYLLRLIIPVNVFTYDGFQNINL